MEVGECPGHLFHIQQVERTPRWAWDHPRSG
jgi:hypothetical protein